MCDRLVIKPPTHPDLRGIPLYIYIDIIVLNEGNFLYITIRNNTSLLEHLFDYCSIHKKNRVETLLLTSILRALEPLTHSVGAEGSQVQILSPRRLSSYVWAFFVGNRSDLLSHCCKQFALTAVNKRTTPLGKTI